jgi:4-amino-4-deoxy-L-arabinose transferase-like glycosyltransferase
VGRSSLFHTTRSHFRPSFGDAERRTPFLAALLVTLAALFFFLVLSESLPPVWDEGDTASRADSVLRWAQGDFSRKGFSRESAWSEETLCRYFPNTVSREGHPAGYVILTAAGKAFATSAGLAGEGKPLSEKAAYRFGVILLWSVALGACFYRIEKSFFRTAAIFSVLSIVFLPRIFVHSQIAFGDSPLISGWILAWACFPRSKKKIGRWILWGALLGLCASAKFSGALVSVPFLLWILGRKDRHEFLALLPAAAASALFVFWLLNPPIWHAPFSGITKYVWLNTHRSAYNIGILFLGKLYSLDRPLPWWNPLFWTAVTVPVGILFSALGLLGAAAGKSLTSFRKGGTKEDKEGDGFLTDDRLGEVNLLFLNWLTLIAVRMFPGLPVHDGVRLFAAAFPFLGILGGLGFAGLWARKGLIPRLGALLLLLGSGSSLFWYFPQGLSYYNLLIGGLPGAARAGMEVTYYWDGLDREVVSFLKSGSPEETTRPILFSAASPATLARWQRWEKIPGRVETISDFIGKENVPSRLAQAPFRWYILQNRGSGLTAYDRALIRRAKPVWIKTAGWRKTPKCLAKTPWGLPRIALLLVYRYEDFCVPPVAEARNE